MYNPGPGAKFFRKTQDQDLLTLVEEYLARNKEQSYVNMDDMVRTLQESSFRYRRMKKGAFANQVKAAYNKYIQMHSSNAEDDEDAYIGPGSATNNNSNNSDSIPYRESELLDKVSSDSDIEIVDEHSNKTDDTLSPISTSTPAVGRPAAYTSEASSSGYVTSSNQYYNNISASQMKNSSYYNNSRNNNQSVNKVTDSKTKQRGVKRKFDNFDDHNSTQLAINDAPSNQSGSSSLEPNKKPATATSVSMNNLANSGNKQQQQSYGSSLKKSKKEISVLQNSDITFKDFAGGEKVIEEICQLLLHLKHPEIYKTLGVTPPRGFLLHGPPGCGKTLLANAIAGETKLPMLKMAATELISGVSGESEGNIRNLFQQAVDLAPCIIFLDEIDAVTPKRETAQREMERRIVAQMLACIDELGTKEKGHLVVLIGATNRLETIDSALRRAGRFDREISLGIPDEPAREKILRVICNTLRLEPFFNFNLLAKLTPGYVGADLQALAREAAIYAISEVISNGSSVDSKSKDNTTTVTTNADKTDHEKTNESLDSPILSSVPASPEKEKPEIIEEEKDVNLIDGQNQVTGDEGDKQDDSAQEQEKEKEQQQKDTSAEEKEVEKEKKDATDEEKETEKEQKQLDGVEEVKEKEKEQEDITAATSSTTDEAETDESKKSAEQPNNSDKDGDKEKEDITDVEMQSNETPSQSNQDVSPSPSTTATTTTTTKSKDDDHEIITVEDAEGEAASTSGQNKTVDDALLVDIADDEDDNLYDDIMCKASDINSSDKNSPGIIDVDADDEEQMEVQENEEDKTKKAAEAESPIVFPVQSAYKWIHDVSAPLSQQQLDKIFIEMRHFEQALKFVQPSAKREGFATVPDTTWNDIGALKDIRDELQVSILGPVKYSSAFKALGINNPAGVLLCGPPGCGKTLLAKAVANEAGINFISVKGPELLNMYVGESERAVRQCFLRAKNSSPCVIFFDELDALCPRRSDGGDGNSTSRVVNQLLTEMDGMESRRGVFIMAATNRPDIIDPAILRPGRLDKILFVDLPGVEDRFDILRTITKTGTKPKLNDDVNLEEIARACENYTGADLAALIREASVAAFRELVLKPNQDANTETDVSPDNQSDLKVSKRHFESAFSKIKPSVSKKDLDKYAGMKEKYSRLI